MLVTRVNLWFPFRKDTRVLAYAEVVFDYAYVLNDVKVVRIDDEGKNLIVAMPCKRRFDRCRECRAKNDLFANYCATCGVELDQDRHLDYDRLYSDIFHPNSTLAKERLWKPILDAYYNELKNQRNGIA